MKQKWYHATPKRLHIGTILTGISFRKGAHAMQESFGTPRKGDVYFTSSDVPHYTIIENAVVEGWHVYQIDPLDRKVRWGDRWDEGLCFSARVVRYVGSARGIASQRGKIPLRQVQRMRDTGATDPPAYAGSYTRWREVHAFNQARKARK
ncbi:hypothetical protein KDW_18620 [Dictyobacter vulcani]|uniref:Uncharacterized protein n=1 Tax=Dictyobacter vulcani TaxID=2607529 RepID=A0A5J4KMS1_9CHLR|nr:hypothetical protein [Dictyobacter vulcani]GER87700.1 hypothetical protein KDW_18620 [Dictyobacter vulcani]